MTWHDHLLGNTNTDQEEVFSQNIFHLSLGQPRAGVPQAQDWLLDSKDFVESNSKLPGHDAVEDEVDHAVGEDQHVHQLSQGGVAIDEKLIP